MNSAGFSAYQLNCNLLLLTAQLFCVYAGSKDACCLRAFLQSVFIFCCLPTVMKSNFGYVASAESFIVDLTAHNKRARVFTTWILLHHSAAQR
jgi:hypothetical protein